MPIETAYTGHYGYIILPDEDTVEKVHKLGNKYCAGWGFQSPIPHVTIFSMNVVGMPEGKARDLLERVRMRIVGTDIDLLDFEFFGGSFLFWNIKKTEPLILAHRESLAISEHLDKSKLPEASSLSLTYVQRGSLEKYGSPFVGDGFNPHITLGAHPSLGGVKEYPPLCHRMRVHDVIFGKMGENGRLDEIVMRV